MPRLSIIVPFVGDVEPFEDTLASVLQNRPHRSEVIVVHGGQYQDPYDLDGEVRFIELGPDRSVLDLINAGLLAAKAAVVHVLLAGVEVEEHWAEKALGHFERPEVAAVSPLVLEYRKDRLVTAGVTYRAGRRRERGMGRTVTARIRGTLIAPTLAAGFYRREAVMLAGGFDGAVGAQLSDIDLGLSLRALGWEVVHEPASQVRMRTPIDCEPAGRFRQARMTQRLFWRHHRSHASRWSVPVHLLLACVQIACLIPRPSLLACVLGHLVGLCESSRQARHAEHLQQLGATPEACRERQQSAAGTQPTAPARPSLRRAA